MPELDEGFLPDPEYFIYQGLTIDLTGVIPSWHNLSVEQQDFVKLEQGATDETSLSSIIRQYELGRTLEVQRRIVAAGGTLGSNSTSWFARALEPVDRIVQPLLKPVVIGGLAVAGGYVALGAAGVFTAGGEIIASEIAASEVAAETAAEYSASELVSSKAAETFAYTSSQEAIVTTELAGAGSAPVASSVGSTSSAIASGAKSLASANSLVSTGLKLAGLVGGGTALQNRGSSSAMMPKESGMFSNPLIWIFLGLGGVLIFFLLRR